MADRQNDGQAYPPALQGWYGVIIMSLAMAFAFLDRQIPTMLIEPIKADLELSDTQIALLGGVAFSIFYALMSLPIGFAVDRFNRTRVLGTGVLVWSLMTTLAAFANSFAKLFGARVGVAVGEAVIAPTSVSLVGDHFRPEQQGKALGIISAGVYVGMGAALIGGGYILQYLTTKGGLVMPGVGHFKPWQGTFLLVGVPGIVVAMLAYFMKEPARRAIAEVPGGEASASSIIAHIRDHARTIALMFSAVVCFGMLTYSFTFWAPTMMVRTYALPIAEVGLTLGTITIVSASIGTICAGFVIDRFRARGFSDAPMRVGLMVCSLALPFAILAPIAGSATLTWILTACLMFLISWLTPLAMTAVSSIATSRTRGRLTALYALVMMVFSMSIGPQLTAFFTDFVFRDASRLNASVSATAAIVLAAGSFLFWLSMRPYRESVERLQGSSRETNGT